MSSARRPSLEVPAALTLVIGSEDLLADRAVSAVIAAARSQDGDTEVREVQAGELTGSSVVEMVSPSLFGERRVVVVRGLGMGRAQAAETPGDDSSADSGDNAGEDDVPSGTLAEAVVRTLTEYADTSDPLVHFVLVHRNASAGRAQLNALRKVKAVHAVDCKTPTRRGYTDFVAQEFAALKRSITSDVPDAMVLAAGRDLRALAAACAQLAADLPAKERIDRAAVESFFAGRVEVDAFAVAEAVLDGNTTKALVLGRQAFAGGASGPAITSAIAYSLRTMIRASSAPRTMPLEEAAAAVGLRDWQLRRARQQLAHWTPEGVARALKCVATADAEVKGAAVDQEYAIERMLITLGRAGRIA